MNGGQLSEYGAAAYMINMIFGPEFPWDDGGGETAHRFVKYLQEFRPQPLPERLTTFKATYNQLIVASPITFASICKHHLLPFIGYAHLGYVSNGTIIGLSKMPRLVDWAAHRPSTQEELTGLLEKTLGEIIDPKGVMVVVEAMHTCACARGVNKVGMWMKTSLPTGVFRDNAVTRQEFLSLISLQGGK